MRFKAGRYVAVVGLGLATLSSMPSVAMAGPSSLVATAASTSTINLRWSGSTIGWVNYVVERSLAAASGFTQVAAVGRSLSYQDWGLAGGRTYYYRIRETRQGMVSNTAAATTFATPNRPPVANAGPDQLTQVGVMTAFSGGGSDIDGTVMSYSWRFGDGTSASGRVVSHAYATSGTYSATLTVTDNSGLTGSDSAVVTVMGATVTTTSTTSTTTSVPVTTTTLPLGPATGGQVLWAKSFAGFRDDGGYGVAVDGSGNVLITGEVQGPVDLGDGVLCASFFVAKYSPTGSHIWSRCAGDFLTSAARGYAIAVDTSGDVLVTGYYGGSALDFGGGPIAGTGDVFVVKYSGVNGGYLWSHAFASALGSGTGTSVAIGTTGDVFVTGWFGGTVDLGGGPLTSAGSGTEDIFIARYTSAGQHVWSRRLGATGSDRGNAVALDATGNVVLAGSFQGAVDFGGGLVTAGGTGTAVYIAKYAPAGQHLWSRGFGGKNDSANGVAVDRSGNVLVAGGFFGTINFGGGLFTSPFSGMLPGGFLVKLSSAGAHNWSTTSGSPAEGVAVDSWGNAVVANGAGVGKYAPSGTPLWSDLWSGAAARDVAVDRDGNVLATGSLHGQVFGGVTLISAGFGDVLFVKLRP